MLQGWAMVEWGQVLRCGNLNLWSDTVHMCTHSVSSGALIVLWANKHVCHYGHYGCIDLILSLVPSWAFQTRARYARRLVKDTLSQQGEWWELVWPEFAPQKCPCLFWHWHSPARPTQLDKGTLGDHLTSGELSAEKEQRRQIGRLRHAVCIGWKRDGTFRI